MMFFTALIMSLTMSAFSAPVEKRSDSLSNPFTLLVLHSGTSFQFAEIRKIDTSPVSFIVGGDLGSVVNFTLDTTTGQLFDSDNKFIEITYDTGLVVEAESSDLASSGWYLEPEGEIYVLSNENYSFSACPSANNSSQYFLTGGVCSSGVSVSLLADF